MKAAIVTGPLSAESCVVTVNLWGLEPRLDLLHSSPGAFAWLSHGRGPVQPAPFPVYGDSTARRFHKHSKARGITAQPRGHGRPGAGNVEHAMAQLRAEASDVRED